MKIIMGEIKVTTQDMRTFFDLLVPPSSTAKKDEGQDWRTSLFESVLLSWHNELEKRQDAVK